MKIDIGDNSVELWLSKRDTYQWANRPNAKWFCSQLSNKRLRVLFDSGGLVDIAVNGRQPHHSLDANELNAITVDFLQPRLPKNHPAWFVTVGQFLGER